MELTLDVEPLSELVARDGIVDLTDEVLEPCFDRAVHLIVSGVRIIERFSGATAHSHDCVGLSSQTREDRCPSAGLKKTAIGNALKEVGKLTV